MKGIRFVVALAFALLALGSGIAFAEQGSGTEPSTNSGVEVVADRTATSQTFELPDGALEARIFENPINYRDQEGDWRPIGEELEEVPSSAITNGQNSFDLSLPEELGNGAVRVSTDGGWVSSELLGTDTEAAEVDGNVASYEADQGGVDFELASLATGLKEDIVLGDASAPRKYTYLLKASNGLSPERAEDGSIAFIDSEGKPTLVLPTPTMLDSKPGIPAVSGAIEYELAKRGEGEWLLILEPDSKWLESPDRRWPVRLDPSVTVPSPSLDCDYLLYGTSTTWTGCGSTGFQRLRAQYKPAYKEAAQERERSALAFVTSSIPANAYIAKATVGLYAPWEGENAVGTELRRATKEWNNAVGWFRYDEKQHFWSAPGGDFTSEGAELPGHKEGWWEFSSESLAALVEGWASGKIKNEGLLLKLKEEENCQPPSCTDSWLTFNSSAAAESGTHPYLAVTYYPKAPATSKMASPVEGSVTANRLKLKSKWSEPEVTGVTYEYRFSGQRSQRYQKIPSAYVHNGKGEEVSWPMSVSGLESEPAYFEAARASAELKESGGEIEVRANFSGSSKVEGYSEAVKAKIDPNKGGPHDATAPIGPGSVDLLTGNFTVARTDVSVPTPLGVPLEFARTASSRVAEASNDKGILGRGWTPSIALEEAGGAEWRSLREVTPSAEEQEEGLAPYALLTDLEGYEYAFEKSGESFITPPEMTGMVLARSGALFTLTDPQGNVTTFEANGGEYLPTSISMTGGSPNSATMTYQVVGTIRRLTMATAPYGPGLNCTGSNVKAILGCRAIEFVYEPATKWGAPSGDGERLAKIVYYGPANASTQGNWEVARYEYDSAGRLIEEWDPRTMLKETYSYNGAGSTYEGGQLKTITPPGQEPWTMEYASLSGEPSNAGRLASVSRPSLVSSPSTAISTVVYGVPLSGSGAPYEMGTSNVAQWGQTDVPADATAIFPPDEVPAKPAKGYAHASVYYMDPEGWQVNTATPSGAGTSSPSITTSEVNEYGNATRELSAQNRLRALAAGSESVTRSKELDSHRVYSADGTEMLEEWGPMHQVRLENGESVQARTHTVLKYDDGWTSKPGETPVVKPHLPTRQVVGAAIAGRSEDADQRVTETKYEWNLRKPTETIIEPSGLNIRSRVYYNRYGYPVESEQPAGPPPSESKEHPTEPDAHTTVTNYYNEEHKGLPCEGSPGLVGLPCEVKPAKQPGTEGQPELLVAKYKSYNQLDEPTEIVESPGGKETTKRTTIKTYDAAGRETTRKTEGGGTPLAPMQTIYDEKTGLPVEQKLTCTECGAGFNYASSFGEAGPSTGQFNHPADVAIDGKGNLWVADKANNRIEEFTEGGGSPKAFGSSGSTGGKLSAPSGITIDPSGNVWVTDTGNTRVEEFSEAGAFIATFGTNVNKTKVEGGGTQAEKNLCTAASKNVCQAGTAGSGEGQMKEPIGIATSSGGNVYVVEKGNGRVEKFSPSGELLAKFGGPGSGSGQFKEPTAIAVGPDASVWVADTANNRIQHWSSTFSFLEAIGKEGSGNGEFKHPDAIEADSSGNVLVADQGNNRVEEFSKAGAFLARFGETEAGPGQFSFSDPVGIATNSKGIAWVTDPGHDEVQKWVPSAGFDSQALITEYDKLGRPIQYTDADGNTSKTTYDLDGRPATVYDGKGTQTYSYDATSGLLTKLEDSAVGTFTAAYNADGAMVEEGLPDGLVAKTTYDETGSPTALSYMKMTNCSEKCTWYEEANERSISGQILSQTSTLSSQKYSYDKAGRLTVAKDTPTGGGCTTRIYAFEGEAGKDSNRTSMTTREPGVGGACAESGGTKQTYSYDAADRLTGSEIEYDSFGRITSLPGKYAGGSKLTTSFFSNEMIARQSQGGITNSYQLDAAGRPRQVTQTGSNEGTEVFHYAAGSDAPAWTEKGSEWTRNVTGIGGELAAIQPSSGEATLQLPDLHGDVVATAPLSSTATKLSATFEFDEFGNPKKGTVGRFSWLGDKQRRTELPSGVIQMGVRSYVPPLGRFITPDPVPGGSANAYDYADQDPVNGFDLTGESRTGYPPKRTPADIRARNRRIAREHGFRPFDTNGCTGRGCVTRDFAHVGSVNFGHVLGGLVKKMVTVASDIPTVAIYRATVEGYVHTIAGKHGGIGEKLWGCFHEGAKAYEQAAGLIAKSGPEEDGPEAVAGYGWIATDCALGYIGS